MKKLLVIELSGDWVFEHRGDDVLPVAALEQELDGSVFEVEESSLTGLVLLVKDEGAGEAQLRASVLNIFRKLYPDEEGESILTVRLKEYSIDAPADGAEEPAAGGSGREGERAREEEESGANKAAAVLCEIDALVGAAEFKALAAEIAEVAAEQNPADVEALLACKKDGKTVEEMVQEFSGEDYVPVSFVSEKNTNVEAVQFAFQTDPIQIEEEEAREESPAENTGFWEKIRGLFE